MNFKEFFKEKEYKKILNRNKKTDKLYGDFEQKKTKLNVSKIKDFGLIVIAIFLIGVGYVRFSDNNVNNENMPQTAKTTNNIGDVQLVNSNGALVDNPEIEANDMNENVQNTNSNNIEESNQIVENDEKPTEDIEPIASSNENQNYFESLRMERNNMYSKSIETYQKIIDSTSISNEQKAIAIQEIEKIDDMQNSILIAEELIRLKGFEDVVIYENSDSITVIVRISALSTTQVAQIQNIVSKQLNVDGNKITISNK